MAAAGLWRSSSSLRPSPADSPLIDSGGARRGRQRGPGAGPGRREPGRLPTPLGLSPPQPPTLHPFPQRIGRRPAGGRGAGAAPSPPPFSGLFFLRLFGVCLGPSVLLLSAFQLGRAAGGPSTQPNLSSQDIPPPPHSPAPSPQNRAPASLGIAATGKELGCRLREAGGAPWPQAAGRAERTGRCPGAGSMPFPRRIRTRAPFFPGVAPIGGAPGDAR